MRDSLPQPETSSGTQFQLHKRKTRLGLGLNMVFSLIVGLSLTVIFDNAWWLAWSAAASLVVSGIVVAALAGTGNWFRAMVITLLYLATIALVYLVGLAAELWLSPLPGLSHYAATYFSLWPPALVLAGMLRLLAGGLSWRFWRVGQSRRLILLRLVPILTSLGVITLATFRPILPVVGQPEWLQPSPVVDSASLDDFMVLPLVPDEEGGLWFGFKKLSGVGGVGHFVPAGTGQETW